MQGPFIKRDVTDSALAPVRYDNCTIKFLLYANKQLQILIR